MMRRTLHRHDRLVLVESPNKCAKITQILQANVKDWTFGLPALRAAAPKSASTASGGRELVAVKPTIGHFMVVDDLEIRRAPFEYDTASPTRPDEDEAASEVADTPSKIGKTKAKKNAAGGGGAKKKGKATIDASLLELPPLPTGSPLLTFLPHYSLSKDNRSMPEVLQYILANRAHINEIILAPDPDREGELIAVHALRFLQKKLNTKGQSPILFSRAYIQAITEEGVLSAMKKRQLNYCDFSLAEAASARHSMDRIFGWVGSTTMRGVDPSFVSIGRVQTPALILVRGQELKAEKAVKDHKASFVVQGKVNLLAPSLDVTSSGGAAGGAGSAVVLSKNTTFTLQQPSAAAVTNANPTLDNDGNSVASAASAAGGSSFASMDEAKAWLDSFEGTNVAKTSTTKSTSSSSQPTTLGDAKQRSGASPPALKSTLVKAPVVTRSRQPAPPPYTMQALLTAANAQLRIGTEGVTAALQDLFQAGLITYPRTDSTRIDDSFIAEKLRPYIQKEFGKDMFINRQDEAEVAKAKKAATSDGDAESKQKADTSPKKKKKKEDENIEDAHEALRPTSMEKGPLSPELVAMFQVGGGSSPSSSPAIRSSHAYPIYKMIFRATVAAFMPHSESEGVSVSIGLCPSSAPPGGAMLVAKLAASRLVTPGWKAAKRLEVTGGSANSNSKSSDSNAAEGEEEDEDIEAVDPTKLSAFDLLKNITFNASVSSSGLFTKVPPLSGGGAAKPLPLCVIVEDLKASEKPLVLPKKFTEGTLIQELKNYGVGRPSTYASILKTLFARKYIFSDTQGRLHTSPVGQGVVNAAQNVFPALVDINFTARFEEELDSISTYRGGAGGESPSAASSAASNKKKKGGAKDLASSTDNNNSSDSKNVDLGEGNNPLSCYTLSRFTYALTDMVQQAILRSKLVTFYRRELVRGASTTPPTHSTDSIFKGCARRRDGAGNDNAAANSPSSSSSPSSTSKDTTKQFGILPGTTLSSNTPDGALLRKAAVMRSSPPVPLVAEIDRRHKNKENGAHAPSPSPAAATPDAGATPKKPAAKAPNAAGSPFDPTRFTLNGLSFIIKGLLAREGGLGSMKVNSEEMVAGKLFRTEEDRVVLLDNKFPPLSALPAGGGGGSASTAIPAASSTKPTTVAPPSAPKQPYPAATLVTIPKKAAAPTSAPNTASPPAPVTQTTLKAKPTTQQAAVTESPSASPIGFGSFASPFSKSVVDKGAITTATERAEQQASRIKPERDDVARPGSGGDASKPHVATATPSSPASSNANPKPPQPVSPSTTPVAKPPAPFDPWAMMGRRF